MHMSKTAPKSGLGPGYESYVSAHLDIVLELPPPGTTWLKRWLYDPPEWWAHGNSDLPERFRNRLKDLHGRGIVHVVGRFDPTGVKPRHIYLTDADVYRYAQFLDDHRETFPCGHNAGFETVDPDKGLYRCHYEFCDETFNRETVEEVMF